MMGKFTRSPVVESKNQNPANPDVVSPQNGVASMELPPQSGARLTKASIQNTDLVRTASASPPSQNTVIAPSTTTTQNTNILPAAKAQNDENTYQRIMNAMYVAA